MHIDFHYYGTYSMARAAGLKRDVCQTIATAAQFVDANDREYDVDLTDGGRINVIPTAHPLVHISNTELFERDQRRVWVPFHFLPGNEGESVSERIICRKDSAIARTMINHCLSLVNRPFYLPLLGIAAHVYADTFSHYGFSGVSSRWNRVNGDSIELLNNERDEEAEDKFRNKYSQTMDGMQNWRQRLWDRVRSGAAESGTGALGHGAVLKYPDYPYLKWEFSYEHPESESRTSNRDNAATFLDACEKLHGIFRRLGEDFRDPDHSQDTGFDRVRDVARDILAVIDNDKEKRGARWCSAAEDGRLFAGQEEILPYQGKEWKERLERLDDGTDSRAAISEPAFRFFQAAATYRTYVLRDLLPAHGLILD